MTSAMLTTHLSVAPASAHLNWPPDLGASVAIACRVVEPSFSGLQSRRLSREVQRRRAEARLQEQWETEMPPDFRPLLSFGV